MCNNHGYPFIATLHSVLLAPDSWDRLFSIITLMNSGHACLFNKGFCTVYSRSKDNNAVTFPHSAQRKHAFIGKTKGMSKKKKIRAKKRIALELLNQRLGHKSTRSLLDGDNANV